MRETVFLSIIGMFSLGCIITIETDFYDATDQKLNSDWFNKGNWELQGFPSGSAVKNPLQCRRPRFNSWSTVKLGGEDPLEEDMATHSRILAWRMQWTEEPSHAPNHLILTTTGKLILWWTFFILYYYVRELYYIIYEELNKESLYYDYNIIL